MLRHRGGGESCEQKDLICVAEVWTLRRCDSELDNASIAYLLTCLFLLSAASAASLISRSGSDLMKDELVEK